ncbi:hypothetical protein [Myceligenerans salitolerans]|uniref:Uncharacterized protein n=1 Tax=Myceligenerans salitolerans TaxID=1230528 RepID=A0ABS3ICX9_9MICO|nr:hypothetical protein [Myceligenerans salitolerans]MBO0609902.1 hypothetical protein [Myceligenerans salitolerans]
MSVVEGEEDVAAETAATTSGENGAATSDPWTRLVETLSARVDGWMLRGGVVAVRVTLADTRSTLASCEIWATSSPCTAWEPRGPIDVAAGFAMPDLERAVVAAGFIYPQTDDSRPKWRVDGNDNSYTLDVMRPCE